MLSRWNVVGMAIFVVISVFALSIVWEFWIEETLPYASFGDDANESIMAKWEFVTTATVFSLIALLAPTILLLRSQRIILSTIDQLNAAQKAASQSSEAKSYFLAHMSHELQTPLNSIIGYSQMMTGEVFGKIDNDRYLGYVTDIQESGHHLLHLINDILDVTRIEAGEFSLDEGQINLDALFHFCLRMIQGRKGAQSLSIRCDNTSNLTHFWGDERVIKQIVLNLLSNAVKYNIAGGMVHLSANVDGDGALSLIVSDTGIGIADEDIARIVEPFGQARSDPHKAHEGTGLGLSLSKQLTELHGGKLKIESQLGKGTTATIVLPPERTIGA